MVDRFDKQLAAIQAILELLHMKETGSNQSTCRNKIVTRLKKTQKELEQNR